MRKTFFKRELSVGFIIILRHFLRQNIMVRDVQEVAIIVAKLVSSRSFRG